MELKQVIVARKDLNLSKGKLSAQVAHASVSAAEKSEWKKDWMRQGQKKSVLKVENEKGLIDVFMRAKDSGLPTELIQDMGKTEIPAGTKTCVGIGPAPEEEIDKVTGELKLY
ncbi:MAG: peptidyl-tRNA hydrolase Pth2 [Candidatus Altiarchaeales archaeon]|nr:peptidyl-tRNA hydrolase Pth2 [Candidatus Altiarchaeota archaeon]MCG2782053.1 peptidyl-tRNA hydrolase Pth2 [Candidatus Altiarchaeales archaeon]MBU4267064.1 peptidyl-tRNA hydrolase Pth2 [Candidatus Altiarchaeota archaeon]MBU4342284.1 peptidyl-tRNA hydrolase Pth2 [Candidatus Altiarchaeota archaeon]MBU4406609.1 peptidyl-tRNA hydrolase Pth2 [Candidatus Altiarchaeota archaeon]